MAVAIEQAQLAMAANEVPIGAVLVQDNKLIAAAHNSSITKNDPTAHAEIQVLQRAGKKLQNYRLLGTTLYVTLEPCAMCAGAIVHARISRVVIGASDPKTGAAGSVFNLLDAHQLNHQCTVKMGVLAEQSGNLLSAFFEQARVR